MIAIRLKNLSVDRDLDRDAIDKPPTFWLVLGALNTLLIYMYYIGLVVAPVWFAWNFISFRCHDVDSMGGGVDGNGGNVKRNG